MINPAILSGIERDPFNGALISSQWTALFSDTWLHNENILIFVAHFTQRHCFLSYEEEAQRQDLLEDSW